MYGKLEEAHFFLLSSQRLQSPSPPSSHAPSLTSPLGFLLYVSQMYRICLRQLMRRGVEGGPSETTANICVGLFQYIPLTSTWIRVYMYVRDRHRDALNFLAWKDGYSSWCAMACTVEHVPDKKKYVKYVWGLLNAFLKLSWNVKAKRRRGRT
jgi:hypothetical protein